MAKQRTSEEKLQFSEDRYDRLFKKTNFRAKELESLGVSQGNAQKAMLNVMEDLEEAKELIEIEKVKDDAMLASIGEGLIAVDNEGQVMIMNRVAEDLLGYSIRDLKGKKLTNLILEDEAGNLIPLGKRPTTIALSSGKITKVAYFFVRKDKTRFPIAITATPIKLDGKAIGLVEIIRDVTHELEIDRAKSEFVSLASHQLRTPLGIMKWYLEALAAEAYFKAAPRAVHDYFDEISRSTERVLALVRDLLSVSRIDQGKVKNVAKQVDLTAVVGAIVKQMQIVAQQKKIKLNLKMESKDPIVIKLDTTRFHEVVENLIGNAVEYTSEKGSVEVRVTKERDSVAITVTDTGIGISAQDQKKLFTKFFRAENAVARNAEGSGLGLYVVKSYVEGWGGKISVKSVLGKGSTFAITLPIKQGGESYEENISS